jgi:hypothetical protein
MADSENDLGPIKAMVRDCEIHLGNCQSLPNKFSLYSLRHTSSEWLEMRSLEFNYWKQLTPELGGGAEALGSNRDFKIPYQDALKTQMKGLSDAFSNLHKNRGFKFDILMTLILSRETKSDYQTSN